MASYLDNTTQFNSYLSQMPIIAERSDIAKEKQQNYNQGIQRIQGQIDNVAGLDVVRDVDKQYLQSKLNELGSKLKTVAAGDFSNFQLVNSVGGMANQIAKDPTVLNSVYSTQVFRKGQQDLQAAKTSGKSSVQNEDWWNMQVNGWMNDKDLKTKFSGEYIPYTDLTEKYGKLSDSIIKSNKGSGRSFDNPYKTNADGTTKYFIEDKKGNLIETTKDKGHPVIDEAMKSVSISGVNAQTLLNNFYDNTTENDRRQLQIDAAYHYKNASPDMFKKDIISTYVLQKKQLTDYTSDLAVQLKNPNLSAEEKVQKQAELNTITSRLSSGELDNQMNEALASLNNPSNLEQYKSKLYTQKYLTNLAKDRSTESYKEELKSNPYFQAEMEGKRLDLAIKSENARVSEFNMNYREKVSEFNMNYREKVREFGIEQMQRTLDREERRSGKEDKNFKPLIGPAGKNSNIPIVSTSTVNSAITNDTNSQLLEDDNFIKSHTGYNKAFLDKSFDEFLRNPGNINTKDNDLREYILDRKRTSDRIRYNGQLLQGAKEATIEEDNKLDNIYKEQKGVVDSSGREIFSAKELVSEARTLEGFEQKFPSIGNAPPIVTYDVDAALKQYSGTKYAPLANAYIKAYTHKPLTQDEKTLLDRASALRVAIKPAEDDIIKQKLQKETEYLQERMPEFMSTPGSLSSENKKDMDTVRQLINLSKNPPPGMIDVRDKKEWNPDVVTKWQESKEAKNLDYQLIKNYDRSGKLVIINGKEQQSIPLTADMFAKAFPEYATVSPADEYSTLINGSRTKTTNTLGKKDNNGAGSAKYTGYDLLNLKDTNYAPNIRYDVEGYYKNTGNPKTDKYQVRVYVWDGKFWRDKVINEIGYVSPGNLQPMINDIGVKTIEDILKQ